MAECRYHGWCRIEYDNDFGVCCPCIGDGVETCMMYEPMPDVESLLKLANEMSVEKGDIWRWRHRIREALGVSK